MSDGSFWTLDHVANSGIELEIRGKKWTFHALTFEDEAAVIAKRKSIALRAYMEASTDPIDGENSMVALAKRRDDMSVIAYGSQAQNIDLADHVCQFEVCRRSLLGSHPDITDAHVKWILGHFNQALDTSKDTHPDRNAILEIISLWSYGPPDPSGKPGKERGADDGA